MKVTQPNPITDFLSSTERTFVIPVYQRNYDWDIENCERMFEDVLEGIKSMRKHYFGNIVYYEAERDPFSAYSKYVLIDGQQRVTSTMLLLAAIRDEESDLSNKNKLTQTYLTNERADENFRVKLKQVETDRGVYESIVEGRLESVSKASTIYRNYNKFKNLVKNAKSEYGYASADLLTGINHLDIIAIDLESEKEGAESPQVIFESINATGKPLSTADLLRNFLLLEVGSESQDSYYKNYWLTIEKNVGNENISDFMRRYLTLEANEDIKKDTEYKEFKKNYKKYFKGAEDAIQKLTHFSKYYNWIKRPEVVANDHPKTSALLQDLDDLRMVPATPAIMWLLEKADTGKLTFDEVNDVFDVIASWSFRARITNIISTGEIGTILTTKILELLKTKKEDESYAEYLWYELSNYRTRNIYPSDEMFKDAFMRYDFYKNYRRYVQQKLSSAISRDKTEIDLESIEHIMPQSLRPDRWPGINPGEHIEWLNTIGNLTPMNMPDNIDNSNHAFGDKIANIKNSDWQITREINTENGWNIESIQRRGSELAEKAITVWRSPKERTREIEMTVTGAQARSKKIIQMIDELDLPHVVIDRDMSMNSYVRFTTEFMDSVIPPLSDDSGAWRTGRAYYYEITNKGTRLQIALSPNGGSSEQEVGLKCVRELLGKPMVAGKWVTRSWKLDQDDDGEITREDLRIALEDVIPQFELTLNN